MVKQVWLLDGNTVVNLLTERKTNERADYQNYLHMDSELFHNLLNLISPRTEKTITVMSNAVSAEERLPLRYLDTRNNYQRYDISHCHLPSVTDQDCT